MAAVILMSIWWCFALCLLNEQSRRVLEEQSLIGNSRPRSPGAANIRPPRPRYGTFEARIGPTSNLPGQGFSNGHNAYPRSSSASRDPNYESATSSVAGWLASTNSHQHDQRPIPPSSANRIFGWFSPNSFPSGIVEPPRNSLPSSGHRPASLLDSTTNPRLIGVPGQSSRRTFSPALQIAQPTSPNHTNTDIPPPYSDLNAPPSYDDCVRTNPVIS